MKNISKNTDRGEQKKIYCANCSHCMVFKQLIEGAQTYVLRIRCSMGQWKKRSGEEKVYKYFSLLRRTATGCFFYDPMGEEDAYIKDLKKTLPVKDEIYSYLSEKRDKPGNTIDSLQ